MTDFRQEPDTESDLQGVRSATLHSALSVDPLFAGSEQPLRISLGFRSTDRHGTLLRSSSQVRPGMTHLQLSKRLKSQRRLYQYSLIFRRASPLPLTFSCPWMTATQY